MLSHDNVRFSTLAPSTLQPSAQSLWYLENIANPNVWLNRHIYNITEPCHSWNLKYLSQGHQEWMLQNQQEDYAYSVYCMNIHCMQFSLSSKAADALPHCIIYLTSKDDLNLQTHLCDPTSCSISAVSALLPKLGQTRWSEAHLCYKNLLKKHWCVQWSRFRQHATLHSALRRPLCQSSAFSAQFFFPSPLPSSLIGGLQSH